MNRKRERRPGMARCKRCGKRIHRTHWTWNGWKHFGAVSGWAPEDTDHAAVPK